MSLLTTLILSAAIVGDGLPTPLTATPGDAERGRAWVADRQASLCLLCHSGPFEQPQLQGNLATPLQGAGSRWTEAQLRLRIVDSRRLNPDSLMPPLHQVGEQVRVGRAWAGKPVLDAQQVEDIVAFLMTLK